MKAIQLLLAVQLFAVIVQSQKQYLNANEDICRLFKDKTKLRKPGTCGTQITCTNFTSEVTKVCPEGELYKLSGSCAKSEKVTDKYCASPCSRNSPKYVADKKNCDGWYQCSGEEETRRGSCSYNMIFDQATQLCKYPEQENCNPTYNLCDVVPSNTPIKDETNCHKYYTCKKNKLSGKIKLTSKTCENQYFNVLTGKCDEKARVDCSKHPIPENVCGTTKLAIRGKFMWDKISCRGYFYCKDLGSGKPDTNPTWGQCPIDEFFDRKEVICAKRSHIACEMDRCDGRTDGFELSPRRGCQHYFVCTKNYTEMELKCEDGLYFDADARVCTTRKISYPICE